MAISAIVRYDPPPMNRLMLDYNVLYIVLVAAGLVFFGAVFLSTRPAQRAKPVRIDAWMGREVVWFAVVIVILVGSLAATIGHTPWSASAKADRQIVRRHRRAVRLQILDDHDARRPPGRVPSQGH